MIRLEKTNNEFSVITNQQRSQIAELTNNRLEASGRMLNF
jgi:hypothetical protein